MSLSSERQIQDQFGGAPLVLYVAGPLRGDGSARAICHNQAQMARSLPRGKLLLAGDDGLAVRAQVLRDCERLLLRCDGMILCGEQLSPGMAQERAVAERAGLPILQVPGWQVCPAQPSLIFNRNE